MHITQGSYIGDPQPIIRPERPGLRRFLGHLLRRILRRPEPPVIIEGWSQVVPVGFSPSIVVIRREPSQSVESGGVAKIAENQAPTIS